LEQQNLGDVYHFRTRAEPAPSISPLSIPEFRETRDMVYSGTNTSTGFDPLLTGSLPSPKNKKQSRRSFSPFTIILLLLGGAIASVLYIGNILAVGRLMAQNNHLQIRHQQIINTQELLKAQINRLSGLERIQQLAKDQLGLRNPKQLPVWIEVNPERVQQIEELIEQRKDRRR
jgi:hypothetical protein